MAQLFANNAFGSLASAVTSGSTTLTLAAGQGARFPAVANGDFFLATLVGLDVNGVEASWEIVKCTARSGDVLTVERAQEGTTALAWPAGARIELRVTAGAMEAALGAAVIEQPTSASYTYDAEGRVSSISETLPSGARTTTYTYDAQGRVTQAVQTHGSTTKTTTYTYDVNGVLTGFSVA